MTGMTALTILTVVILTMVIIWAVVALLGRNGTRIVVNKRETRSVKDDSQ
jgi:uncharacterized membrane protein